MKIVNKGFSFNQLLNALIILIKATNWLNNKFLKTFARSQ